MSEALARAWYRGHPALWLLLPLSVLYGAVVAVRRWLYRTGVLASVRVGVPVIVVGNVTVGGTGKTPLTLALIERLRAAGFRPGVVSRGYGGKAGYPLRLDATTPPAAAGDEPVMLHRRSGVPLVVDPVRSRAARHLLANSDCDVVICDDGLQHLALARDIEIAVVDGTRGLGNGHLLPAGPLREPARRLAQVDLVVVNAEGGDWPGAHRMRLLPDALRPVAAGAGMPPRPGDRVHAVAGIGNPARFFLQLESLGFVVVRHAFPDHHAYAAADLAFGDALPVVMTEKDKVKCEGIAPANAWYLPVSAKLPEPFYESLMAALRGARQDDRHAG